jgi:hypothetical protein
MSENPKESRIKSFQKNKQRKEKIAISSQAA